ncbi:MAG: hypothetical protein WDM96_01830 [Lacunisphaera sp.]
MIGDWGQLTYTFDDIVKALNAVEPLRLGDIPPRAVSMPSPSMRRSTALTRGG